MKKTLLCGLSFLAVWLFASNSGAQEAVRININFTDSAAENANLDAFVARYGCFVDAGADAPTRRTQRRQCREVAVLKFLSEVEDGYQSDTAVEPARAGAVNARRARWQPGVAAVTPTPTPKPAP